VHISLLRRYSPFFNDGDDIRFATGVMQQCSLGHTVRGVFTIFTRWLEDQEINFGRFKKKYWREILLQLWILADNLIVPTLQNAVIDALEKLRGEVGFEDMLPGHGLVYQLTRAGSPLRRYLVASALNVPREFRGKFQAEHYTQGMLVEMLSCMYKRDDYQQPVIDTLNRLHRNYPVPYTPFTKKRLAKFKVNEHPTGVHDAGRRYDGVLSELSEE